MGCQEQEKDYGRRPGFLTRRCRSPLLALALAAAGLSGCSPIEQASPEPTTAPVVQPAIPRGIFNGGWRRGGKQFYDIEHNIGETPVVRILTNAAGRAEATNIRYEGRKLEFDQIEYAVIHESDFEPMDTSPLYAETGCVWRVTMRVSINNPHTLLLEKTDASVLNKTMLYRMPRATREEAREEK